jgi:hypothetical protein
MVASVGAPFAPQRGLRCCTKPQAVLGFCSFLAGFYLQIEGKRKWTRGDSNPWPPPCEGGEIVCWRLLELAKLLQIEAFGLWCFSQHFRRFTRVAARLLHNGLGHYWHHFLFRKFYLQIR